MKARQTALNPAKINFRNALAVLQAWFRKQIKAVKRASVIDGLSFPQHMWEQTIWRRTQVRAKSPMCWTNGSCVYCGCEILGKTMEDRGCEERAKCYPEMMNKPEWEQYKKENNIKLFS